MFKKVLFFISLYFIPFFLEAKVFNNSYVSLDLPTNWNCYQQGTEWICHEKNKIKGNEAIIVIVAKERSSNDKMINYTNYLKKTKMLQTKSGPKQSKVNYVRNIKLAQQKWVDGMHFISEADPYYTRYLATVTPKLGILVSFTVHKNAYSKYGKIFSKAVNSLRVNRLSQDLVLPSQNKQYMKNLLNARNLQKQKRNFLDDDDFSTEDTKNISSQSGPFDKGLLYKILGGILLIGALVFFVFKMRKN